MSFIKVDRLEKDMVLAENIVNDSGIVVLGENTKLTDKTIAVLNRLGCESVKIKDESIPYANSFDNELMNYQKQRQHDNEKLKVIYNDTVNKFRNVYDSSKDSGKIDIAQINDLMEPVLDQAFSNTSIVSTFMSLNEQLGEYTYKHSINVGLFSAMIGKWIGLKEAEIKELATAGVLHDIGKSKTPAEIINKAGKLTDEEFEIIKRHPQDGYYLIKDNPDISDGIKYAIHQHHERVDGTGYPYGLTSDEIHPYAKIVAVSDVYDSLTSVRSYKKAICPFKVYEILLDMSNTHLDYSVSSTFIKRISSYFIGSFVRLNNDENAKIIMINKLLPTRPLLLNEHNEQIDLSKNYELEIEEIL